MSTAMAGRGAAVSNEKLLRAIWASSSQPLSISDLTLNSLFFSEHFAPIEQLGAGSFAKVVNCHHKISGQKVAVKFIPKDKLKEPENYRALTREITLLSRLEHPNIVRMLDIVETPDVVFVILEYCAGGELVDHIVNHKRVTYNDARRYMRQLVETMGHVHQNGVVHRDLKPENILLDENDNVKIIDFGLGNVMSRSKPLNTFCGSPAYAAPELVMRHPYWGPPVDVWAIGIVFYMLITGGLPFTQTDYGELYRAIRHADYHVDSSVWNDSALSLLRRMLVVSPKRRATIQEILSHPWLQGYSLNLRDPLLRPSLPVSSRSDIIPEVVSLCVEKGYNEGMLVEALLARRRCTDTAVYFLLYTAWVRIHGRSDSQHHNVQGQGGQAPKYVSAGATGSRMANAVQRRASDRGHFAYSRASATPEIPRQAVEDEQDRYGRNTGRSGPRSHTTRRSLKGTALSSTPPPSGAKSAGFPRSSVLPTVPGSSALPETVQRPPGGAHSAMAGGASTPQPGQLDGRIPGSPAPTEIRVLNGHYQVVVNRAGPRALEVLFNVLLGTLTTLRCRFRKQGCLFQCSLTPGVTEVASSVTRKIYQHPTLSLSKCLESIPLPPSPLPKRRNLENPPAHSHSRPRTPVSGSLQDHQPHLVEMAAATSAGETSAVVRLPEVERLRVFTKGLATADFNLRFAIEVCRLEGCNEPNVFGLRFARMSGDSIGYTRICSAVLELAQL